MKIAQCKYTKSGMERTLHAYFDNKAFEFISPPMTKDQEEDFIRTTCDSIAANMPYHQTEKHFYIKRIYKPDNSESLQIFCTDGFLIDDALSIPITHQAFAIERIKVTESEQLPIHFKLSNDLLNLIHNRLPTFEQAAKKAVSLKKSIERREPAKQQLLERPESEYIADKSFDVYTELTRVKKRNENHD